MQAALLSDRGVVKIAGDDARKFLNGLITADMDKISPGTAGFAALLTPQGKIIADFMIAEAPAAAGGGFFLDCARQMAPALVGKLNAYKLRAKIMVEDLSETLGVLAVWGGAARSQYGLSYPDPRLAQLGLRCVLPPHQAGKAAAEFGTALADASTYEAHRIALGVPRGGPDFAYGDAFPHEADMDQLGGVDFSKGCFVGQEVVSRMQHRGTARTRVVPVVFDGPPPATGVAVTAGDKTLGAIGSTAGERGLAMLRLDRVDEALAGGIPLQAGTTGIRLAKPGWAQLAFPGEAKVKQ